MNGHLGDDYVYLIEACWYIGQINGNASLVRAGAFGAAEKNYQSQKQDREEKNSFHFHLLFLDFAIFPPLYSSYTDVPLPIFGSIIVD